MAASGRFRGSKNYLLVYCEMIRAARYGGLTTYQEIARIMDLPLSGQYMGSEIAAILGEISEDELREGRPMLSAVVVGVSGRPGKGFYGLARQLGRMNPDETDIDVWERERRRVYATWKRTYRKR